MSAVRTLVCCLTVASLFAVSANLSAEPQSPSEAGGADAEYVTVSLDTIPSTDGKALMIGAYGVIFGLFLLYGASLLWRERAVAKRAEMLKRRLESR